MHDCEECRILADELLQQEVATFKRYKKIGYTKSNQPEWAKAMVLLSAKLQRGPNNWMKPFIAAEAKSFFGAYLTEKNTAKKSTSAINNHENMGL